VTLSIDCAKDLRLNEANFYRRALKKGLLCNFEIGTNSQMVMGDVAECSREKH
jgi:hypothetical protein